MTNLSTEAIRELIKLMKKTLVDDAGLEMSSFQNSEAEKQFKEAIVALKQLSDSKFTISRPKSIGQAHRVIVQMQAEITQLRKDKASLEEALNSLAEEMSPGQLDHFVLETHPEFREIIESVRPDVKSNNRQHSNKQ